ncbi:MAG: hypothetical protein Ta2D_07780 [Rickettsiales bacterium]|nr:MAG: hypothetical protein Ta2D_07780 [Rickettsiales bacterium]
MLAFFHKKQIKLYTTEIKKAPYTKYKNFCAKGCSIRNKICSVVIDLTYLDFVDLARIIEQNKNNDDDNLRKQKNTYKPLRNAVMHTALLTKEAKEKLKECRENIINRVQKILSILINNTN